MSCESTIMLWNALAIELSSTGIARCLVLHSVAEQNGVSMFRKGGHRPRSARAFLRCSCVIVTSQKSTQSSYTQKTHNTHKRRNARRSFPGEPRRTILKRIVVVAAGATNARSGRAPKNKQGPPTRAPLATPVQHGRQRPKNAGGSRRAGH